MFSIWYLCQLFLRKRNPTLVYYMLRWVVLMFLLPVAYVAILVNYHAGYVWQMDSVWKTVFVISKDSEVFQLIALIWFVITIINLFRFSRMTYRSMQICRNNFDDGDSLAQDEFERVKEILGLKGKISLLRNDSSRIKSPFITGIMKRRVVVPYAEEEYDKDDLKIIFYHELTHYKKHDLIFKMLTILVVALQSFNPCAYLLLDLVSYWSECDCDNKALNKLEKEGISINQYYHTILRLLADDDRRQHIYIFSMLFEKKDVLERRIDYMKSNRKNFRTSSKVATVAITMAFILASTVTSYAAGLKLAEGGDVEFKETQEVRTSYDFTSTDEWSEEFTVTSDNSGSVNTLYMEEDIMPLTSATFNWTVPVGTRCVTSTIYFSKGTEVSIVATATPSTCTYWFGLMYPDNSATVVEGTGAGNHVFTIPSSGYYRIMVENRSTQEINVAGAYSY